MSSTECVLGVESVSTRRVPSTNKMADVSIPWTRVAVSSSCFSMVGGVESARFNSLWDSLFIFGVVPLYRTNALPVKRKKLNQ